MGKGCMITPHLDSELGGMASALENIAINCNQVVNLSAAELPSLKICRYPYLSGLENCYVHGSQFDFLDFRHTSLSSFSIKPLIQAGVQLASAMTRLTYC